MYINSSRIYLEKFVNRAANSIPPGSQVLDAGSGDCPYRNLFSRMNYESADFCQVENAKYGKIDYVCDLAAIPVEDERYDLILCTQVLEHLPEPLLVLKEFNRILKPGKSLWLSAPLFYEEHQEPFDFFRYTKYGLAHLVNEAGFEILETDWLEGYYGTLSYQLRMAAMSLPTHAKAYGGGVVGLIGALGGFWFKFIFRILSILFSRLDVRYRNTAIGLCKNHTLIAKKI